MWRLILFLLTAFSGFWLGTNQERVVGKKDSSVLENIHPEAPLPLTEYKSFTIVMYAYNQSLWCTRALSSVFEQDYDHYRVIFIDDGSSDNTIEKAKEFIVENNQIGKVTFVRNEEKVGRLASIYRAIVGCFDREIILPLDAKDWLVHPSILNLLNIAYQSSDVWLAKGASLDYPTYELKNESFTTFYAALFKQVPLQEFYQKKGGRSSKKDCLAPLTALSEGHIRRIREPIIFSNLVVLNKNSWSNF